MTQFLAARPRAVRIAVGSVAALFLAGSLAVSARFSAPFAEHTKRSPTTGKSLSSNMSGEIDALIHQLSDRSPDVRDAAAGKLIAIGRRARPALDEAASTGTPQRKILARALLAKLPLFDDDDPPALREELARYQATPPEAQAGHALRLLSRGTRVGLDAVARIILETSDDKAVWPIVARASAADRVRLVASHAMTDATPEGCPQLYLFGAALIDTDHLRALSDLDQCLGELRVAPAEARPALRHLTELLAQEAQAHQDADRELQVRRDAAMLTPATTARGEPSDLFGAYLSARLRLGTLEGYDDDLRTLGVKMDGSAASLVPAILTLCPATPAATTQAAATRPADAMAAIRSVPTDLWTAIDATRPDDVPAVAEMLCRAGRKPLAYAIARRMSVVGDATSSADAVVRAARFLVIRSEVAPTPQERSAARAGVHNMLAERRDITWRRNNLDADSYPSGSWPADMLGERQLFDARHAWEREDLPAFDAALDRLVERDLDNSNIAIDAIYLLDQRGRFAEADEIYENYLDDAEARLALAPDDPGMMNRLAWFCGRTGRNIPRAYELAVQSNRGGPPSSARLDTQAECAFHFGRAEDAVGCESRALDIQPDEPFMLNQLDRFKAGVGEGDRDRSLVSESWDP